MKSNEILKIYGTEYKEMTKRLLFESGLYEDITAVTAGRSVKGNKTIVAIKPNLVSASEASYGATTHPEVIAGIVEYLREKGDFDIRIMEGAWVGDNTARCFKVCGYDKLSREYDVPLIDTQKDNFRKVDCSGMELSICDSAFISDYLINVPVLKGHCQTRITCALKNMKGLIPNKEKRRFHTMGLHKPIAHLNTGIKPDFIVIDHICGDLDFEDGGNPVVRNCVMAAKDPVLTDAYVCKLLGYGLKDVAYIGLAESLGIGSADLSRGRVAVYDKKFDGTAGSKNGVFVPLPQDKICDEAVPDTRKILELNDVVNEVDSCSACYGYLIPALDKLKNEGLLDKLKEKLGEHNKICIGQGYRGKNGNIGIGNCTNGFDFTVKGCPPTEEEIYQELLTFIE